MLNILYSFFGSHQYFGEHLYMDSQYSNIIQLRLRLLKPKINNFTMHGQKCDRSSKQHDYKLYVNCPLIQIENDFFKKVFIDLHLVLLIK